MGRYADTTRYPPVDSASVENTLTVRDAFLDEPHAIPRDQWRFGRMTDGWIALDISALYLKGGFQPGYVYELSYEASGAVVAGLAFAALRDMASAGKHRLGVTNFCFPLVRDRRPRRGHRLLDLSDAQPFDHRPRKIMRGPWTSIWPQENRARVPTSIATLAVAGSCRTLARWPVRKRVTRTICPLGNSNASWGT
jgi:hypothetical protein